MASLLTFGGSLVNEDGRVESKAEAAAPEMFLEKPVKDGERFIKKELLRALRSITAGMIEKAKAGNTAQLKLLWQLGKLHEDATSKKKAPPESLGRLLMDEVRRREAKQKLDDPARGNDAVAGQPE
jgi:hypothetical protein